MLKTILVVDDDEALADNWEDILSDEGYQLISANTCADALTLIKTQNPHVALLDLKLPDDSGINLLAKIKESNPDCICALMTAFADLDSAITALEKGAFHYLQKPVRPIELINLLERIFETIQIREEKRITEDKLKESERRFRTIFESAQDAIFLKDANLKYTLVNPVMERIYGIKAEDFLGQTDEDLFGDQQGFKNRAIENRVLQGEIVEEELKFGEKNKSLKIFHSIKVPLSSNNGQITGICGFARDMTSIKQLEAQLLQAQKMEAIGTLAGGISHDFNNLLQAILGYSQMLLVDENKDSSNFPKLKEIEKAAVRASELTTQLLTFSRKVELHPRPVDLNQIIRQVEKLLKRTIPKMINIELHLDDSIFTVNADPGQLHQVLLNIGVNARDAMPNGGQMVFKT
ncbi:MAG: response regulator, partial [Desulfobacteraceae bacterium]